MVCGNYDLLQSNTINSTSEGAIRIDSSCNPGVSGLFNNFSANTIDEACTNSLVDPAVAGSNTIGFNTSYNVGFNTLSGTLLSAGYCSSSDAPTIELGSPGLSSNQRIPPTPVAR